jgi:hypothetical protein
LADVADSFFAESGSRRTLELGRAGRNAGVIAAAPAAMERSAAPGEHPVAEPRGAAGGPR